MATNAPHLLTPGEASDRMRTTTYAVTKMAISGDLPSVLMPDGTVRFLESDIAEWITDHRRYAREAKPA